jgi:hypothetical protein
MVNLSLKTEWMKVATMNQQFQVITICFHQWGNQNILVLEYLLVFELQVSSIDDQIKVFITGSGCSNIIVFNELLLFRYHVFKVHDSPSLQL